MTAAEPAASRDAPVRVLIVDDQKVVREGLVSLLSLLPGIDVVGAAIDGDDAIRQVPAKPTRRRADGPEHATLQRRRGDGTAARETARDRWSC